MSIGRLSYAKCDRCGDPAPPADSAAEARDEARRLGWIFADGEDICGRCCNPDDVRYRSPAVRGNLER